MNQRKFFRCTATLIHLVQKCSWSQLLESSSTSTCSFTTIQILGLSHVISCLSCHLIVNLYCLLLAARQIHFVVLLLDWFSKTDISINVFSDIIIMLLSNIINIQNLWNIFLWYIHMSDEIVRLVAFYNKWISMAQYCCFNLSDSFMFLYDNSRSIAIRDKIKFISQPLK